MKLLLAECKVPPHYAARVLAAMQQEGWLDKVPSPPSEDDKLRTLAVTEQLTRGRY